MPAGRWLSPEFFFYYLVLAFCFYEISRKGVEVTQEHLRSGVRQQGIQRGWLSAGSFVDLSDTQWRIFRAALPALSIAAVGSGAALRLVRAFAPNSLPIALVGLSAVFTGYLHGSKSIWPLCFASLNFVLARLSAKRPGPGWSCLLWVANCAALLWVQRNGARPFGSFAASLAPLDKYKGSARWETCFNLLVLRMISFDMDLRWSQRTSKLSPGQSTLDRRIVQQAPSAPHTFGPALYYAYCFFPPLYLAGPIITYNSFTHQVTSSLPLPELQWRSIGLHAARLALIILCLEVVTHLFHVNALALSGAWRGRDFKAVEVGVVGFWVLQFMWLKFTAIWRFFRLWALLAGVCAPENMLRCINNNYDIEGFWKSWHASYNRWLVRYLYIPLGGARTRVFNIWIIFSFVALWHDPEPRLLKWAWLMALFLMPEIGLKWLARMPRARKWQNTVAYRLVCAAAAAVSITVLMSANLVGFVIGLEGLKTFLRKIFCWEGAPFSGAMFLAFFSAANIMFEIREAEARGRG